MAESMKTDLTKTVSYEVIEIVRRETTIHDSKHHTVSYKIEYFSSPKGKRCWQENFPQKDHEIKYYCKRITPKEAQKIIESQDLKYWDEFTSGA